MTNRFGLALTTRNIRSIPSCLSTRLAKSFWLSIGTHPKEKLFWWFWHARLKIYRNFSNRRANTSGITTNAPKSELVCIIWRAQTARWESTKTFKMFSIPLVFDGCASATMVTWELRCLARRDPWTLFQSTITNSILWSLNTSHPIPNRTCPRRSHHAVTYPFWRS